MKKRALQDLSPQYALYQSLYWMSACFVYSYTRVFLQKLGFSVTLAGVELALSSILSVLMQPLLASALGRWKKLSLRAVIAAGLGLSLFCGVLLLTPVPLAALAVLFLVMSTMTLTVQPFINSVGFGYINAGHKLNYSAARGVASLAYAALSKLISLLAEEETGTGMLLCYLIMTLGTLLVTLYLAQGTGENQRVETENNKGVSTLAFFKKYPSFSLMLLGQLLIFFQHNCINGYMWDIVQRAGGTAGDMGTALLIGALAEVPALLFFTRIEKKCPCHRLLQLAAGLYVLKPLLILVSPTLPMLYLSQAMQAVTYALVVPGMAYYSNRLVAPQDRIRGQALITGSIAAAGFFGYLFGGVLVDAMGITATLWAAVAVGTVGSLLLGIFSKPLEKV